MKTARDDFENMKNTTENAPLPDKSRSLGELLTRPLNEDRPGASQKPPENEREVLIGGKRIVLEAGDTLELRCGESVIRMNKDGVIEIRGNYVISQSTATQRIRGGSVHIN